MTWIGCHLALFLNQKSHARNDLHYPCVLALAAPTQDLVKSWLLPQATAWTPLSTFGATAHLATLQPHCPLPQHPPPGTFICPIMVQSLSLKQTIPLVPTHPHCLTLILFPNPILHLCCSWQTAYTLWTMTSL